MANTYTQLYIHFVFAVQFRKAVLNTTWEERLRLYITAIVQNNNHKMIAINNVFDHLHCFLGLNPAQSISTLMQLVKGESSEWINKNKFTSTKFSWQGGYGAFSHSKSQIDSVAQYICNQHEHHKKITFLDEYAQMLKNLEIDFDNRYIFKPLAD